jgi:hypothetical protein
MIFMGALATNVNRYAVRTKINPAVTLVVFFAISYVCGFIDDKYIIFRDQK